MTQQTATLRADSWYEAWQKSLLKSGRIVRDREWGKLRPRPTQSPADKTRKQEFPSRKQGVCIVKT